MDKLCRCGHVLQVIKDSKGRFAIGTYYDTLKPTVVPWCTLSTERYSSFSEAKSALDSDSFTIDQSESMKECAGGQSCYDKNARITNVFNTRSEYNQYAVEEFSKIINDHNKSVKVGKDGARVLPTTNDLESELNACKKIFEENNCTLGLSALTLFEAEVARSNELGEDRYISLAKFLARALTIKS